MVGQPSRNPRASRVIPLLLLLLLAVGCGAAATPTAVLAPAAIPQAPVVNPGKVTPG